MKNRKLTNYILILHLYSIPEQSKPNNMAKTTSPLVLICLVLLSCICHQTFSFKTAIRTRHEQCLSYGYQGGCDYIKTDGSPDFDCTQLRCALFVGESPEGKKKYIQRFGKQPVEGTYCGPSSYCSRGECVYSEEESQRLLYTGSEYNMPGC